MATRNLSGGHDHFNPATCAQGSLLGKLQYRRTVRGSNELMVIKL